MSIQIQPERSPFMDVETVVAGIRELSNSYTTSLHVTEGQEEARYINLIMEAAHPRQIWEAISNELSIDAGFANAAIVCCQGNHGWDDYLLLHHFDRTEPLDELNELV
ncbi:MAG: hypothetical protein QM703_06850 [Gemmatales bacterium]